MSGIKKLCKDFGLVARRKKQNQFYIEEMVHKESDQIVFVTSSYISKKEASQKMARSTDLIHKELQRYNLI